MAEQKILPKYCSECGRELRPNHRDESIQFDMQTGKPYVLRRHYLVCPKATDMFTSHTIYHVRNAVMPVEKKGRRWMIAAGGEASGV